MEADKCFERSRLPVAHHLLEDRESKICNSILRSV